MAWGSRRGVDDLIDRVKDNDSTLGTLCILSGRTFGPSAAEQLCAALETNTHLTEVLASGHDIGTNGVQAFSNLLVKTSTLTKLAVGDKNFGDDHLEILSRGLEANTSIRVLDLEGKCFGEDSVAHLSRALGQNKTLTDLRLGRNNLGNAALSSLCEGLRSNNTLSSLDLSECDLKKESFAALAALASLADTGIKSLKLCRNPMDSECAQALVSGLTSPACGLHSLWTRDCRLTEDCAPALRELLVGNNQLVELRLTDNCIGVSGALRMISGLEGSSLAILHLSNNGIGDEGAAAIAKSLIKQTPPLLTNIDLSGNNITGDGAQALAALSHLKQLHLFNNQIGDQGATSFAQMLDRTMGPSACALEYLDLGANEVGPAGAEELCQALRRNTVLNTLELFANDIGDIGEAAITDLEDHNSKVDVAWRARGGDDDEDPAVTLQNALNNRPPNR